MRRPPLLVVFVAVLVLALGETAGAFLSLLRPPTQRYALARIAANASAHGLTGAAEYDDEIRDRTVFAAEAGVSFLHTHAEGLPTVVLVAATLVATTVPWRRARAGLYALLGVGTLFPLGWLVYALAVLERGREAGVELAETWVLAPLGSAVVLALVGLLVALAARGGREHVA
jgi:hypothetical protein